MALTKLRGNTQIMDLSIENAQIANGTIADAKLVNGAEFLKRDGSVVLTGTLDAGGFKLVNAADGTAAQDYVTKNQLDSVSAGITTKESVQVATVTALPAVTAAGAGVGKTLTADIAGVILIDGEAITAANGWSVGDRVLVKDQVNPLDNGIYGVATLSDAAIALVLVRTVDFDGTPSNEVSKGAYTFVFGGTTLANTGWTLLDDASFAAGEAEVDIDPLNFTQFQGKESTTASNGLLLNGNNIEVSPGNGIDASGADLTLALDGSTLAIGVAGVKLADLASGNILVGNGSNVATGLAMNGDVTMDNLGATTIATGAVVDSMINAGAAIQTSKLADGAEFITRNGTVAYTGNQVMGGYVLSGLGAGTVNGESVRYEQLAASEARIDNVAAAAGFTADAYVAEVGSNYLKSADFTTAVLTESLHNADQLLDAQIKAVADDVANLGTGSLTDIQNELNEIESNFGGLVNTINEWTGFTPAEVQYLDAATNIEGAFITLDGEILANSNLIAAIGTPTGTGYLKDVQDELDATQAGAGLAADGTFTAFALTNFLDSSTSLYSALSELDTNIQTALDAKLDDAQLIDDDTMVSATASNVPSAESVVAYVQGELGANTVGFVDDEAPTGIIDGANVTFTVAGTPSPVESVHLFVNGQRLRPGAGNDYTVSGSTITMIAAPLAGDQLSSDYRI